MSATNREVQLRKTCQLYAYVLSAQGQEIPETIQECADAYDYPVDCVKELYQALEDLDTETFDKVVNDPHSLQARNLASWWKMYQTYIPLS